MHFGSHLSDSDKAYPFLLHLQNSVAFLKVYLMPTRQFELLVKHTSGCLPFTVPEKAKKSKKHV